MAKTGLSLVSIRIVASKLLWIIHSIMSSNFSVLFMPLTLMVAIFQMFEFIERWCCGFVFLCRRRSLGLYRSCHLVMLEACSCFSLGGSFFSSILLTRVVCLLVFGGVF